MDRHPPHFSTAAHTAESRERALAGGAVAYLRKPVDDQALLDAIDKAVPEGRKQEVSTELLNTDNRPLAPHRHSEP